MSDRRWVVLISTAVLISVLAGCSSGGSTASQQNPPPPPQTNVSIAFQQAPPAAALIGSTVAIAAIVSNDSSNSGVEWTLSCQNAANCGSLSALTTQSGQTTIYTPPVTLPANSEIINIAGFSVADNTKNVLASINVTAFGSNLAGTYVFAAQGVENVLPYQIAGQVVLDGNGNITSGQQTADFNNPTTGSFETKSDSDLTGTYFLGADGRGTMTINTADTDIDPDGKSPEVFSLIFVSTSQLLISALPSDYFNSASTGLLPSGTGTMNLQTSTALPSTNGYAFVVSGTDVSGSFPQAFGGILDIDASNNVAQTKSQLDGLVSAGQGSIPPVLTGLARPTGSISSATNGIATFTVNATFPTNLNGTGLSGQQFAFTFTGYVVSPTNIQLIETDGNLFTAGRAIEQSAYGSFTTFTGTYVFGVNGTDLNSIAPNSMTSAGWLDVSASIGTPGTATGSMNTSLPAYSNPISGTTGAEIDGSFGGSPTLNGQGTGRAFLASNNFATHYMPPANPSFIFYLTGGGNPALVLENGNLNYPFLGAGIAYQQAATPAFSGNYGVSFTQTQPASSAEDDGTGWMTATASAIPPSLSGIVDSSAGLGGDLPFTGTFGSANSNDMFIGTLLSNSSAFLTFNPFNLDFYMIDGSVGAPGGFFVETDVLATAQVTLGYYAAQSPLACPTGFTCSNAQRSRIRRGSLHK